MGPYGRNRRRRGWGRGVPQVTPNQVAKFAKIHRGQLDQQSPAGFLAQVVPEAEDVFLAGFFDAAPYGLFVQRFLRHAVPFVQPPSKQGKQVPRAYQSVPQATRVLATEAWRALGP